MREAMPLILAALALGALAPALWLLVDGLRARAQARRFNRLAPPPSRGGAKRDEGD